MISVVLLVCAAAGLFNEERVWVARMQGSWTTVDTVSIGEYEQMDDDEVGEDGGTGDDNIDDAVDVVDVGSEYVMAVSDDRIDADADADVVVVWLLFLLFSMSCCCVVSDECDECCCCGGSCSGSSVFDRVVMSGPAAA